MGAAAGPPVPRGPRSRREHGETSSRSSGGAAELICLAGYMRLLSPDFIARYRGRILNIHPALLPVPGPGCAAPRSGRASSSPAAPCTSRRGHDSGPVILQRRVPILPGDTVFLSARILAEEHRAYPEAIARVLAGEGPPASPTGGA